MRECAPRNCHLPRFTSPSILTTLKTDAATDYSQACRQAMGRHKRAVFIDRDGTLNEEVGYLRRLSDLRLCVGAAAAVRQINQAGWLAIVLTNQSGVARGLSR